MYHDRRVALVIPAYNEEKAIGQVLASLPDWLDDVVVADNNSRDRTAVIAAEHGAIVVHEPRGGYGSACLAGLTHLAWQAIELQPHIVVFMDADRSDDPQDIDALLAPLIQDQADLVIGSRVSGNAEAGSLTTPQRFGNALATFLLRKGWGQSASDLGPMRAINWSTLLQLRMDDLNFGWTVQMQARALAYGFRTAEVPVAYRRRVGQSKISGTVRGVIGAGTKILTTIGREFVQAKLHPVQRERFIVFTRLPEAGTTKTRMIPALGAQGAADLQHDMTTLTFKTAQQAALAYGEIDVRHHGGTALQMEQAFGNVGQYLPQGQGTLGQRMLHAFEHAHKQGCHKTVCIGSDCPSLTPAILQDAMRALSQHDLVLGPALDGGYYLIGMTQPQPVLFENIEWGTSAVLAQTLKVAQSLGLRVHQLPQLSDVDVPEDLAHWQAVQDQHAKEDKPWLSVIIPALNEARAITRAIKSAMQCPNVEIIVVDGGSNDGTHEVAQAAGARVVESAPGRGRQQITGATVASGKNLLFLHADTRLPFGYWQEVSRILEHTSAVAGAFEMAFDTRGYALGLIEWGTHKRAAWRGMPYGDQALFMTRHTYEQSGGFKPLDVMEDWEFVRRLRKLGPVGISSLPAITSARKYIHHGPWRTVAMHQRMLWAGSAR